MSDIKVSIIGSAGRKEDANFITKELYEKLLEKVEYVILTEWKLDYKNITLVSGGAAFCDHLAVSLFNKYPDTFKGLIEYIPCKIVFEKNMYEDTGVYDWRSNPGNTTNYYHKNFSKRVGFDSLKQLCELSSNNKVVFDTEEKGFHSRNTQVAKSDYMIAITRGETDPASGGTKDTWDKCKNTKLHISFKNV
jgi:hypothetical protein